MTPALPTIETNGLPNNIHFSGLTWCQTVGACPVGPTCDFTGCAPNGAGFAAGAVAVGTCIIIEPCGGILLTVAAGAAVVMAGTAVAIELHDIYKLRRDEEGATKCWNEFIRDIKDCHDAYPPGPHLQGCYAAAQQKLQLCRATKGIH
jgi:hypothetical protein